MNYQNKKIPYLLRQIPKPPKGLWIEGDEDLILNQKENGRKYLCIVGARKYTDYGKEVCRRLILGLKGYDICIVSGLAIGIDSLVHKYAMEAGLPTIAFPGSGLEKSVLYPRTNLHLAEKILDSGGALVSEFDPKMKAEQWIFPQRNRLMAGISHATLVIEASLRSGSLITSRLALDYNREVMVVPGGIFSENSAGPNMLIKIGATPITSSEDILESLNIKTKDSDKKEDNLKIFDIKNPKEEIFIKCLSNPKNIDEIVAETGLDIAYINVLISRYEIIGKIFYDGDKYSLLR